jgi:5-methylcytosine-specific restriction endonuclease McrA
MPVGYKTVKDAIISLTGSESKPEPSSHALDIEYGFNSDGSVDFDNPISMRPVTWSEWITLPIREWDLTINGANRTYRVPTVIIAINFDRMPVKSFKGKPSKESIWMRDGGIDQYTGKQLSKDNGTLDHIIPRSRGGLDTWENLVLTSKEVNSKKSNKTPEEAGLKLIRKPKTPTPTPVMHLIKEARHNDWKHFLVKQ